MWSYYLKCRKNTESKSLKDEKKEKGRKMLSSKSAMSDSKKSKFIKGQEASGLINSLLGVKSSFARIPVLVAVI